MDDALTAPEFASLLATTLGGAPDRPLARVAVAVSGGADSLALAVLTAEALGVANVTALIVDHGLRPEAAAEAAVTTERLAARAITAVTLKWDGAKPATGIQAAARAARYRLLEDWCASHGVPWLLLGHHRRDQAETVLLRMARGSGVDGLAAMAPARAPLSRADGPWTLRPLLTVTPERLRAALRARAIGWVEDPSNDDAGYDRVKARRLLADAPLSGLEEGRLANTAMAMARARAALETYADEVAVHALRFFPTGHAEIDVAALAEAPEEIGLRLLARALAAVGGRPHGPRFEQLAPAYGEIVATGTAARTLGGCQLMAGRDGRLLVCREAASVGHILTLGPGATATWDRRFAVALDSDFAGGVVAKLDLHGWRQLRAAGVVRRLPAAIGAGQPALWRGDEVLAVPTLGFAIAPAAAFSARFIASTMPGAGDMG